MKKAIIASVIAMTMGSGVAHAAPDANAGTIDLDFSGTVSTVTCPLEPSVGGIAGKNSIALGQTDVNTEGAAVEVVFKPTATGSTACSGASDFVMQWNGVGSAFDSHGLKASGGAATDSYVLVKATNAQTNNNQQVNADGFQYEFASDKVKGEGMKYTMSLKGGAEVGDMTAAAQVKHWYK